MEANFYSQNFFLLRRDISELFYCALYINQHYINSTYPPKLLFYKKTKSIIYIYLFNKDIFCSLTFTEIFFFTILNNFSLFLWSLQTYIIIIEKKDCSQKIENKTRFKYRHYGKIWGCRLSLIKYKFLNT